MNSPFTRKGSRTGAPAIRKVATRLLRPKRPVPWRPSTARTSRHLTCSNRGARRRAVRGRDRVRAYPNRARCARWPERYWRWRPRCMPLAGTCPVPAAVRRMRLCGWAIEGSVRGSIRGSVQ